MEGEAHKALEPLWKAKNPLLVPIRAVMDLWNERNLIRLLVKRDFTSRYRRAGLGVGWAILEPLLLAAVYTFIFQILVGTDRFAYPLLVFIGAMFWRLFSTVLSSSSNSLIASRNLFQFARVPKSIFAASSAVMAFQMAFLSMVSILPFMWYYDLSVTWAYLMIPIWLGLTALVAWSMGLLLAPVATKIPDIMHGIRFLLRVGFFLSPVMWTYDMFGRRFGDGWLAALVQCNPTIVPITEVRSILLSEPTGIPPLGYQVFVAVSALSFIFGTIAFDTRAHKAVIHA